MSVFGRARLLCFVGPRDVNMLYSISSIIRFLLKNRINDLDILLFSSDPEALEEKLPAFNDLYLGNDKDAAVFRRNDKLNFYLYDKEGQWIRQVSPGLEPCQLIWKLSDALGYRLPSWSPDSLLDVHKESQRLSYLSSLRGRIESSSKSLFVLVFLDSICSSCQSGRVVDDIKALQEAFIDADFSIVLPPEYDERDLANIKNNEKLNIDLIRSSREIAGVR